MDKNTVLILFLYSYSFVPVGAVDANELGLRAAAVRLLMRNVSLRFQLLLQIQKRN